MKIASLICANGMGHFRRAVGVLAKLLEEREGLELIVACEAWQVERSAGWPALAALEKAGRFVHGLTHPGPGWSLDPARFDDGRLIRWEQRLLSSPEISGADRLLSDNLVGALTLRSDAVLLGSFLWSDVFDHAYRGRAEARAFIGHERGLLEQHRPPMLCVADLAMSGVLARTDAVPLPWMCEHRDRPARAAHRTPARIAVLSGFGGAGDAVLDGAAHALEGRHGFEIIRGASGPQPDFDSMDLVVCRPGVGTLTASIAARVPLVVVREPNNLELDHNARRAVELRIAIDAGSEPSDKTVLDAVDRALSLDRYRRMSERMAALPSDGLERAARELARRFS